MRPARLRLRRWGGHVVVYDDRSGDTHLLEDPAGSVLERLLVSAAGNDELLALAGDVQQRGSGEQQERCMVQLNDVLRRLHRLGIVKPLRK